MKTRNIWTMVMFAVMMFTASLAFAGNGGDDKGKGGGGDTTINVTDKTKTTNIIKTTDIVKTNAESDAYSKSTSKASADGTQTVITQRDFIGLPTAVTMMNAPAVYPVGSCIPLYGEGMNASYTLEQIRNYAKAGSFTEKKGGMWHGLWHGRERPATGVTPFTGEYHTGPIHLINWDMKEGAVALPGDKKLGNYFCEGDYGYGLDVPLSDCLLKAFNETNTERVGACYYVRVDGQSSGIAYGGAAGGSGIANPTTAVAGAASAVLGTSTSYANIAYDVRVWALNAGLYRWPELPKENPAPTPEPPPAKVEEKKLCCDMIAIERELEVGTAGYKNCDKPCLNNGDQRLRKGTAFLRKFYCTGMTDQSLLVAAIAQFKIGEDDIVRGHEPNGKKTISLEAGRKVLYDIRYNWSLAIRKSVDQGRSFQISFGEFKGLNKEGSRELPTDYEDIR